MSWPSTPTSEMSLPGWRPWLRMAFMAPKAISSDIAKTAVGGFFCVSSAVMACSPPAMVK